MYQCEVLVNSVLPSAAKSKYNIGTYICMYVYACVCTCMHVCVHFKLDYKYVTTLAYCIAQKYEKLGLDEFIGMPKV